MCVQNYFQMLETRKERKTEKSHWGTQCYCWHFYFTVRTQMTVKKKLPFPQNRREHWKELINTPLLRQKWRLTLGGTSSREITTSLRPDIVVWFLATETVLLIELIIPREEAGRRCLKRLRYSQMEADWKEAGWRVVTYTQDNSGGLLPLP